MEADKAGRASCVEKSKVLLTKPERKKLFQNPKLRWENDIKQVVRLTVGVWIWVHVARNWVLWNSAMSWCVRGKAGKVWRGEQLLVSEEGFSCLCRLAFNKGSRLRTLMGKYVWINVHIYVSKIYRIGSILSIKNCNNICGNTCSELWTNTQRTLTM